MSLFQLELRVPIHRSHSRARYSWNSHWLVSADLSQFQEQYSSCRSWVQESCGISNVWIDTVCKSVLRPFHQDMLRSRLQR